MKKRTMFLGFLFLVVIIFASYFTLASNNPIYTNPHTLKIENLVERENYRDMSTQKEIHSELNRIKSLGTYSKEFPLTIWNPYGTVGNSLYLYFETDKELSLSYTISANGYNDFSKKAKNLAKNTSKIGEYLLIGFIPDKANTLTLSLKDKKGEIVYEQSYTIIPPTNESFAFTELEKITTDSTEQLSDGLYTIIGAAEGNTIIFDNEGTIRADLLTDSYRVDRIVEYGDSILIPNKSNEILKVNGLGEIETIYSFDDYEMHHDFILTSKETLLILATETSKDTNEDMIIELDLKTGEVIQSLDMVQLMTEYVDSVYKGEDIYTDSEGADFDWLHLNSIQLVNEDEIVVSSRELSTIIKIDNIFEKASIDYMIGQEDIFKDTDLQEKLLTKVGDFADSAGQHSVNVEHSEDLKDSQYYLYFFNNNYWRHNSNLDYNGSIPEGSYDTKETQEGAMSQYKKYLVDENERTYTQVQSLDVPYSGIVSNVQHFGNNIIVNSGVENHTVQEYTSSGELIAVFSYSKFLEGTDTNFVYREQKLTYNNLWFEE